MRRYCETSTSTVRHLGRWGVDAETRMRQIETGGFYYDHCCGYTACAPSCHVSTLRQASYWCDQCFALVPVQDIDHGRMVVREGKCRRHHAP